MFDDLRTELEKKVQQLKQDIGDTQTLIESIKQTAEEYLIKINKAQADAIVSITDALLSSNQSIDLEREEALRQIDAKRDAIKTDYDLASDTFQKFMIAMWTLLIQMLIKLTQQLMKSYKHLMKPLKEMALLLLNM